MVNILFNPSEFIRKSLLCVPDLIDLIQQEVNLIIRSYFFR
jgi:hypothetical protein